MRRNLYRDCISALCFTGVGMLAGCGGSSADIDRSTARPIVELYGESSLTGYGLKPGEGVAEFVQAKMTNLTVINEAVNGTTTREMLDGTDGRHPSFVQQMARSKAALVVIDRGSNEAVRNIDPAIFRSDLQQAIDIVQASGKQIVLMKRRSTRIPAMLWLTLRCLVYNDNNILHHHHYLEDFEDARKNESA